MGHQSVAFIVLFCLLATQAWGHGKEARKPNLPAGALAALAAPRMYASTVEQQHVAVCYTGYELMPDGTCVKEIIEPLLHETGEVVVPYIAQCPPGFQSRGEGCFRENEIDMTYFCPVGWYDDGSSCAQAVPGEVTASCDVGDLIGDLCVIHEHVPYTITPTCPDGSRVEKDGNCWKMLETFDCTPQVTKKGEEAPIGRIIGLPEPPATPVGTKVLVSKEHARLRNLHPKKRPPIPVEVVAVEVPTIAPVVVEAEVTSCVKEMVAVSPPHPTKVGIQTQTCVKEIQVDAIAIVSCPEGFLDTGSDCLKETSKPVTTICSTTGSTQGECPPLIHHSPKYPRCPDGTEPLSNGKCLQIEVTPGIQSCAEGFEDNGQGCYAILPTEADNCRPGLTLVDGRCVGQSIRPAIALSLTPRAGCQNKY